MLKVLYKVLQDDLWHLYVAQWWGEKESAPV